MDIVHQQADQPSVASCNYIVVDYWYQCYSHGIIWHCVENPSMVDPQRSMLYWGSKWIFQTVCWDVVGCDWGTTAIYFGITYVCFIHGRLSVFVVVPKFQHRLFLFLSKVEQILSKLKTSFIWCCLLLPFDGLLGVTYATMLVATQWPMKHALNLTSLSGACVVWRSEKLIGTICAVHDYRISGHSNRDYCQCK